MGAPHRALGRRPPSALRSYSEPGGPGAGAGQGAGCWGAQLGGHTLRRGLWAVGLRAGHLTVLPIEDGCFFTCRGERKNRRSGQHSPCPQSEPYCSCSHTQSPSQLPEMARRPAERRAHPGGCQLWPPVPPPGPAPPTHPGLLTAGAVQQLHDPKAVVQQGFGPHQLQAPPPGTQEGWRFRPGAGLHNLGERTL